MYSQGPLMRKIHMLKNSLLLGSGLQFISIFFCLRFDPCVDGPQNSIAEVNCQQYDTPFNRQKNAFVATQQVLKTELQAKRNANPISYRYWKIFNPNKKNIVGEPTAYRLTPGSNSLPYASPDSPLLQRVGFLSHNLWVTPYEESERFPAGEYPNQAKTVEGLPKWTQQDRPIENTDIVLWYTMGATHVVRLEDWPIMPVADISVQFAPSGFFDYSPTVQTQNTNCTGSAKL